MNDSPSFYRAALPDFAVHDDANDFIKYIKIPHHHPPLHQQQQRSRRRSSVLDGVAVLY